MHSPKTDSKREGGEEEAPTKGAGAGALALLLRLGPGDPAQLCSPAGAVAPARQAALTHRRDDRTWHQQGWFLPLCYSDSASRCTKGEGGTKFSTPRFTKYKLLSTLKWQQSPLRLHLTAPLNSSCEEHKIETFSLFCSQNTTEKQPGEKRGVLSPWTDGRERTLNTVQKTTVMMTRRSFSIKGMGRITATDQSYILNIW